MTRPGWGSPVLSVFCHLPKPKGQTATSNEPERTKEQETTSVKKVKTEL